MTSLLPPSAPTWRDDASPACSALLLSRGLQRVLVILACLLVTAGALAGTLAWFHRAPQPRFLPLLVAHYSSTRLPENGGVWQDAKAFSAFADAAPGAKPGFVVSDQLMRQVQQLREASGREPLVIYLSCHALLDRDGQIALLTSDSNPLTQESAVRLQWVLERLAQCTAPKLLVLDLWRPLADPELEVLQLAAADRLPQVLAAVDDPNRVVLCSSSPGENAHASEVLRRTPFAYYFQQALSGRADGFNTQGTRDGRLTTEELVGYVTWHTQQWAQQVLAASQTPVCYRSGEHFELDCRIMQEADLPQLAAGTESGNQDPAGSGATSGADGDQAAPELRTYPEWLTAAWTARDQWLADGHGRLSPQLMALVEARLLRIEQAWRYGGEPGEAERQVEHLMRWAGERLAGLQALVGQSRSHSLAVLRAEGHKPDPKLTAAVLQTIDSLESESGKGASAEKALAALNALLKPAEPDQIGLALSAAILQRPNLRPPTLQSLVGLWTSLEPQPKSMESSFLRRLAKVTEQAPSHQWPPDLIGRAFQAVWLDAEIGGRLEAFYHFRDDIEAAALKRHEAEVMLFAVGYASLDQAYLRYAQACRSLQQLAAHADTVMAGHHCLARAMRILPSVAIHAGDDRSLQVPLGAAIETTQKLAGVLKGRFDSSNARPDRLNSVENLTGRLSAELDALLQPFSPPMIRRLREASEQALDRPQLYQNVRALLATPLLTAADRKQLHDTGRELARVLNKNLADQTRFATELQDDRLSPGAIDVRNQQTLERQQEQLRQARALLRLGQLGRKAIASTAKSQAGVTDMQASQVIYAAIDRQAAHGTAGDTASDYLSCCRRCVQTALQPSRDQLSPQHNLAVQYWRSLVTANGQWRAAMFDYFAHDFGGPGDFARFAGEIAPAAPEFHQRYVQFFEPKDHDSPIQPVVEQRIDVPFSISAAEGEPKSEDKIEIAVWTPAPEIQASCRLAQEQERRTAHLHIKWSHGSAATQRLALEGVLLSVQLNGRHFHLPVPVPALPSSSGLEVAINSTPEPPQVSETRVQLRAGSFRQPRYLWITNLKPQPRDLLVRLHAGNTVETPLKLAPLQRAAVHFPGKPPAAQQRLPELDVNPVLTISDAGTGKLLLEQTITAEVLHPRSYVRCLGSRLVTAASEASELEVTLQAQELPPGPPCTVELNFSPQAGPGWQTLQGGMLRGALAAPGDRITLSADSTMAAAASLQPTRFFVAVDGVPRALLFRTITSSTPGTSFPRDDRQPRLVLDAPLYVAAGQELPVRVAVDNPPTDCRLRLSLGRAAGATFQVQTAQDLPSARDRSIGFAAAGKGGALLFDASISDWLRPLDTTGLVGAYQLQAKAFDAAGAEVLSKSQTVIIDATPPVHARLVGLRPLAVAGGPLLVEALADDPQSGIAKACVFLGEPVKHALPPEAKPVSAQQSGAAWSAALTMPKQLGPTKISVGFVNQAGLQSFATVTVTLVAKLPPATGAIHGVVLESERPQAGLVVKLRNEKGREKRTAETAADGTFKFSSVPPGKYQVQASKPSSRRSGAADVEVKPNQAVTTRLELSL